MRPAIPPEGIYYQSYLVCARTVPEGETQIHATVVEFTNIQLATCSTSKGMRVCAMC
jgi:hypothetical protein